MSNNLTHESFKAAVDGEVARLEGGLARGGQAMATVGLLLALYAWTALPGMLGPALSGFAVMLLIWFTTVRACVTQGVGVQVFQWLGPVVEVSLPTVLVLIDARTQGAEYAASSSVPMQFYAIFLLGGVLRLRWQLPLLAGLVAATEYALTYWFILKPGLVAAAVSNAAFRTDMMFMRSVVLLLGGGVGALVNFTLRQAVATAGDGWRAQQLFGKYRILERLAEGGMGSVHKALYCPEGGFQRPVALKQMHPHLARNATFVSAFRNEAELSSRLTHPNICQVLDFGRVEDTYFLAMEYVEGMTLAQLTRGAQSLGLHIPANLVAAMGVDLCAGLAFAHHGARDVNGARLRVVHRDLNPPNVLLSRRGELKILDFGIARAMGEARQQLTASTLGKAAYMAPEQLEEKPMDERVDLFACGVMLWELLAGRRLFQRTTDAATALAVMMEDAPTVGLHRPDVAVEEWDAFFRRALAKDPDQRFQWAKEMGDHLDRLMRREGLPPPDALVAFMTGLPEDVSPRELATRGNQDGATRPLA